MGRDSVKLEAQGKERQALVWTSARCGRQGQLRVGVHYCRITYGRERGPVAKNRSKTQIHYSRWKSREEMKRKLWSRQLQPWTRIGVREVAVGVVATGTLSGDLNCLLG